MRIPYRRTGALDVALPWRRKRVGLLVPQAAVEVALTDSVAKGLATLPFGRNKRTHCRVGTRAVPRMKIKPEQGVIAQAPALQSTKPKPI
ncbi:MAG: hypothetical protein OSB19_00105 [Opitutaceae bacterium]|nr:hypothetical protein [Opitutaceae bacterium]